MSELLWFSRHTLDADGRPFFLVRKTPVWPRLFFAASTAPACFGPMMWLVRFPSKFILGRQSWKKSPQNLHFTSAKNNAYVAVSNIFIDQIYNVNAFVNEFLMICLDHNNFFLFGLLLKKWVYFGLRSCAPISNVQSWNQVLLVEVPKQVRNDHFAMVSNSITV